MAIKVLHGKEYTYLTEDRSDLRSTNIRLVDKKKIPVNRVAKGGE